MSALPKLSPCTHYQHSPTPSLIWDSAHKADLTHPKTHKPYFFLKWHTDPNTGMTCALHHCFLSRSNWACFIWSHSQPQSSSPWGAQPCQFTLFHDNNCAKPFPLAPIPNDADGTETNEQSWSVAGNICWLPPGQGRRAQRKATCEA